MAWPVLIYPGMNATHTHHKPLTLAMQLMLEREPEIMDLRPEAGPVVRYGGSAEHRTVNALKARGLVKTFSLCPYESSFFRRIGDDLAPRYTETRCCECGAPLGYEADEPQTTRCNSCDAGEE